MTTLRFILTALCLAGSAAIGMAYAPQAESSDEDAVRRTVQYYFDGSRNADSATMRKGFRTDVAHMFFVREGQLVDVPIPQFLVRVAQGQRPGFQPDSLQRRVLMVDVSGSSAIAKLETLTPNQRVVDYMSLLKIGGEWQIVTKIFDRIPLGGATR